MLVEEIEGKLVYFIRLDSGDVNEVLSVSKVASEEIHSCPLFLLFSRHVSICMDVNAFLVQEEGR